MSTIPVFIPFVNRPDLLHKAIASVPRRMTTEPVVINNSGKPLDVFGRAAVITPSSPLTFAATQNLMWDMAKKDRVPFYMFLHSDAEAGTDTVEQLWHRAMHESSKGKWGAIFTNYDSLAAYSVEAMDAIVGWDGLLPWYLSDCDCYRRLRLAGFPTVESNLPVYHTPSQTLNSDPEIAKRVAEDTPKWRAYYAEKWGGPNEAEKYEVPFNGKA
jgi:hypothetical protein